MKKTSITFFWILAACSFAAGLGTVLLGQSVNAATSGTSLITLDQIQKLMFAVAAMLGGIFFALVAIFLKVASGKQNGNQ